jgi:hypothetical protein
LVCFSENESLHFALILKEKFTKNCLCETEVDCVYFYDE